MEKKKRERGSIIYKALKTNYLVHYLNDLNIQIKRQCAKKAFIIMRSACFHFHFFLIPLLKFPNYMLFKSKVKLLFKAYNIDLF